MREELLETEAIEMPALDGEDGASTSRPPGRCRRRSTSRPSSRPGRARRGPRRSPPPAAWSPAPRPSPWPRDPRRLLEAPGEAPAGQGAPGEGARQPLVHGRRPPARPVARVGDAPGAAAARGRGAPGVAVPAAQPPRGRRVRAPARRGGLAAAVDARRPRRRPRLAAGVGRGSCSAPGRPIPTRPAGRESLELAIERMRFALGVDEDLTEFARTFRGDPLIGEIIHHRPWLRPRRRPWPWEALAWAVTEQLIEAAARPRSSGASCCRWGGRLQP